MFKKILVCLDGSPFAEQIIPYTVKLAQMFQSTLVLLRCVELGEPEAYETVGSLEVADKVQKEAIVYLERNAKLIQAEDINTEFVTLQGTVADNIVNYADKNEVDIIAIATHGYGGFKRMILGSVADQVVRNSTLPKLLITPKVK